MERRAPAPGSHPRRRPVGGRGDRREDILGGVCIVRPDVWRPRSGRGSDAGDVSEGVDGPAGLRRPLAALHLAVSNRLHDVSESHPPAKTDDVVGLRKGSGGARYGTRRRRSIERPGGRRAAAERRAAAPRGLALHRDGALLGWTGSEGSCEDRRDYNCCHSQAAAQTVRAARSISRPGHPMRPNRKADLQRKLTLAAIPTPPAGLAQRIKTDIPKHFPDSTAERQRLGSAVAFNVRVAASILLLVGSLFVALHILNRAVQDADQHMRDFSHSLENNKSPSAAASPVPKLPQSASKVVTSTEEPPVTVAPPEPKGRRAEAEIAETKAKKGERQLVDADTRRDREKAQAANRPANELANLDKKRDDFGRAFPAASPVPVPAPPPYPPATTEESAKAVVAQAPAASARWNAAGVNATSTPTRAAPQKSTA